MGLIFLGLGGRGEGVVRKLFYDPEKIFRLRSIYLLKVKVRIEYVYFGLHEVKTLLKIIGERSIKYTTTFFEWFIYHRQFCLPRIITFIY